ncbi:MAG: YlxR family protein [Actinomycetota bacterium]|nr:YlxR family protein [Actinomycetota bacterium]
MRVIRRSDGTLGVGRTLLGRGAWVCTDSPDCIEQAERRNAFTRALRGPIEPGAVDEVRKALCISSEVTEGPLASASNR